MLLPTVIKELLDVGLARLTSVDETTGTLSVHAKPAVNEILKVFDECAKMSAYFRNL